MLATGCFVTVKSNSWGTGKLLRFEPSLREAEVEYFDSPTTVQRPLVKCLVSDLQPVGQLNPETRVYFYDRKAAQWRMGRISGHVEFNCFIALPNKEQVMLAQEEVFVRWHIPPVDPTDHLKAMLTETPFFQTKRQALVAHLVRQRAVAPGLTALLAAPLLLERHQLEVVRRVLDDPVQRYLLADEVGLGKTIEAGMIARQHVLDHPDGHFVIVVVPATLVNQWSLELIERCQIGGDFGQQIWVISYEDFVARDDLNPDLLIVDEAHQITRPDRTALYQRIRQVSDPSRCAKLLLLSATPIRGNELGFLSLLHLLDPTLYRLDAGEDFQARVAQRQELADIFVTLVPEQDEYFLEQTAISIRSMFPGDVRLQTLIGQLLATLAGMTSTEQSVIVERHRLISAVRVHLAETYRLDRRFLRNRRSGEIDGLLPGRAGLKVLEVVEESTGAMEDLVETWRARAARACAETGVEVGPEWDAAAGQFRLFLEAAWTSPEKFIEAVKTRLTEVKPARGSGRQANRRKAFPDLENETSLLERCVEQAREFESAFESKLDRVCEVAIESAADVSRVVVMCTEAGLADTLFRRITIRSPLKVFRCTPMTVSPETWLQRGIIVCDAIAEEGLNLQGGATVLLHVDLPLSPNRLEQRMGRLDRIGKGKAVRSATVVPKGTAYLSGWVQLLNRGWEVFDRSIASLQYVVEDEMKALQHQLLVEGSAAFQASLQRLAGDDGLISKERRAIHNQDELDALGPKSREIDAVIDGIETYEKTAEDFSRAMHLWLQDGLGFLRIGEQQPADSVGRYHYRSPGRGSNPTLIAQTDFLRWFGKGIDRAFKHPIFAQPLSWPMASHRHAAISRRVGAARLGHPWIDAVESHLRWDDRGTAVALWRCHPHAEEQPKAYLRFSAVVEANHSHLVEWCAKNTWANSRTVLRLADAAFPPVETTVWVDPEFSSPAENVLPDLERTYNKDRGDTNITGSRWGPVLEKMNLTPQGWLNHCTNARAAAEKAVVVQSNLAAMMAERLDRHRAAYEEVNDQLLSRCEAMGQRLQERNQLERDRERQTALYRAFHNSIKDLKVRFDSVGAVFLGREPFR